jgi:hypothetical protein
MAEGPMGSRPGQEEQHGMRERAEHVGEVISDKAHEAKEAVSDRANELADTGKARFAEALDNVADRAHRQADALTGRGGVAGRMAEPAHRAAHAVESSAEYLRTHEWQEMRQDLQRQIGARPLVSVALAFGAGLLLAQAFGGEDDRPRLRRRGGGRQGRSRQRSFMRSRAMAPVRKAVLTGVTSMLTSQIQRRIGNGQQARDGRPHAEYDGNRPGARF